MDVAVLVLTAMVVVFTPFVCSNRVWVWLGLKERKEYTDLQGAVFFVASSLDVEDNK